MAKRSRNKAPRNEEPLTRPSATLSPRGGERGLVIAAAVAIVAAIWLIYSRSLAYPFTNFDDFDYIVDNRHVNTGFSLANLRWALTALYASNWHPLTWISHQLDVSMFGVDAGKLRIVSILLHCASSVLLLVFLLQTTGRRWASVAAAAIFALHPMRVESVVWVSERKDTLSTFLFLATLLAYAAYARKRSVARWIAVFVLFILGLAAKPMLITLPFVLLLLDYWPLRRELTTRLVVEKLPLFALIIPSAIVTMRAQKEAMNPVPLAIRIGNAVASYGAYVWKLIWPESLAIMYPFNTSLSPLAIAGGAAMIIAFTFVAFRFAKRAPYVTVGWLWFAGTLVPVIGVIQVGAQSMADRYTYVPSIGLIIAVVWFVADLLRNRARLEIGIATAIIVSLLAIRTFTQVGYWRDTLTLFERAIEVTPANPQAVNALGREYLYRNEYPRAIEEFKRAIAIDPNAHEAHDALGTALSEMGDTEGAEREIRAAIAIFPRPVYYRDLGQLLATVGRVDESLKIYEKALTMEHDPETLAEVATLKGNADDAIRYYREAIIERPRAADLHNNLAALLTRKGREDEAIAEYQKAVQIAPKQYDVHMNLGVILSRHNRISESIDELQTAAQIRPSSPEPHVYLALVAAQTGKFADAAAEIRAAGQMNEAEANESLTNALNLPPKPTNLRDYLAFLESKTK